MFDRTQASTCCFLTEEEEPMARLLAIDLHPKTVFVVAADEAGRELWHRRFETSVRGREQLLAQLQPGDRVVLEATFGAEYLACRLESVGAQVTIADPAHARLLGMRGKKTDYRDCRALLEHLRAGTLVAVWRPDPATREIRQLTRERQAYNRSLVALKNRVRALLWEEGLNGPEHLWSTEGQAWLSAQTLPPVVRQILERELVALAGLTALKEAQEVELARRAVAWAAAQRLMQIPGFGPANAVMLLGEIGAISRFASAKQLVSYAGLNPRVHQSGEHCRGGRISKAGRSQLRWLLIEAAWSHVRANGPEAARFQRLVGRGKAEGVAIVALARQLLVLAYHLLTREESYRGVEAAKYEGKLIRLATYRPSDGESAAEAALSNVDWAAAQLQRVTGLASPYRQAHPRARPGRRRPQPRRAREGAGQRVRAAVGGAAFPALGKSDPAAPPTAAGPGGNLPPGVGVLP
jgi:transposase